MNTGKVRRIASGITKPTKPITIRADHIFTSDANRDTYFTTNPTEKTISTYIASNSVLQKWNGTEWVSYAYVIKGQQGDQGDKGDIGLTGNGITSITRTAGTGAAGTTDTYTITFTDSTTTTFQVVNGTIGTKGDTGAGFPTGGTTGQVLRKKSATDFDTEWKSDGDYIAALTDKTTPVDTDVFRTVETSSANTTKKVSWANIKLTLKAFFGTVHIFTTNTSPTTVTANEVAVYSKSDERIYRKGYKDATEYALAEDFRIPRNRPAIFCNGVAAYISVANNLDINFGVGTFSYIGKFIFENGNTLRYKITKIIEASNLGLQLRHETTNKIRVYLGDGTNLWYIESSNAIADGKTHVIGFGKGADSTSTTLVIDGIEDTTAVKSGTFPTGTLTNTSTLYIGTKTSISGFNKTETDLNRLFNYKLTIAQFQKYSYEDLAYEDVGGSNTEFFPNGNFETGVNTDNWALNTVGTVATYNDTNADKTGSYNLKIESTALNYPGVSKSNVLTVGKRYKYTIRMKATTQSRAIVLNGSSGFTATTTMTIYSGEFIATQAGVSIAVNATNVTETLIIDDFSIIQAGCVLNLTPETINPLKWNCKNGLYYGDLISAEAIGLPINHNSNFSYKAITGNATVTIPKGYSIDQIYIKNTTANAVTGFKLGTTFGGTEVVGSSTITGSFNDVLEDSADTPTALKISKKFFSDTANTTLYLQATTWNSASLDVVLICRRVV